MKLSLKVEYACQVLAQLGNYYGRSKLPHIEDLAGAEQIPSNYLVQILNELRTGGLIASKRGKQGGYSLAREPKQITLYQIVCAVEGELLGFNSEGKGASAARTALVWSEIEKAFAEKTQSYTVADLMSDRENSMWYI